ncbi:hypothetical protein ACFQS7_06845 [Dankookia sp. GCM10030260]|uniref:hypothetical protein n=1 Tax=Dankookia sp. GCM10030260 TaxID=3273390 RepID=UPI003622DEA4
MSMVRSSLAAHTIMVAKRPALATLLHGNVHCSRQAEQAPDEAAFYPHPILAALGGRLHSRWHRKRIASAQKPPGVPPLSAAQNEAIDLLDAIPGPPSVMHAMHLALGAMQLLNVHVPLHLQTEFEGFDDLAAKRLLFRPWQTRAPRKLLVPGPRG